MNPNYQELHVVFDAPPGRDMPTLIEIEDESGRPIAVGQWRERPDGYWELVIPIAQNLDRGACAFKHSVPPGFENL